MLRIFISILALAGIGSFGANQYLQTMEPEKVVEKPRNERVVMGYLSDMSTTSRSATVKIDDAVWLLGEDAVDVAMKDKKCEGRTRETCLPNNFYIRNVDSAKVLYQISDTVEVYMQTYKPGEELGMYLDYKIDLDTFARLLNSTNDKESHFRKVPYNVLMIDNIIVKITEIYLP